MSTATSEAGEAAVCWHVSAVLGHIRGSGTTGLRESGSTDPKAIAHAHSKIRSGPSCKPLFSLLKWPNVT
jgi:hypothetical protein